MYHQISNNCILWYLKSQVNLCFNVENEDFCYAKLCPEDGDESKGSIHIQSTQWELMGLTFVHIVVFKET